jgi:hypothetical protein
MHRLLSILFIAFLIESCATGSKGHPFTETTDYYTTDICIDSNLTDFEEIKSKVYHPGDILILYIVDQGPTSNESISVAYDVHNYDLTEDMRRWPIDVYMDSGGWVEKFVHYIEPFELETTRHLFIHIKYEVNDGGWPPRYLPRHHVYVLDVEPYN